jgi:hypothetical protein
MGPKTGECHRDVTLRAGPGIVVTQQAFRGWSPCLVEGRGSRETNGTLEIVAGGSTFSQIGSNNSSTGRQGTRRAA